MATRITQEAVETLTQTDPNARVTQEVVEAVTQTDPNARVTALAVEVVRSVADVKRKSVVIVI